MPIPTLPALSPRSATEIVDGSVQLIRPAFPYFLKIAAVGAIPALIQALVTMLWFGSASADPAVLLRQQITLLPITLLTLCFALVQSGAVVGSALSALKSEPLPSVWTAYMAAFRRILPLIGATLLLTVVAMLMIVPVVLIGALVVAGGASAFTSIVGTGTPAAIVGIVLLVVAVLASMAVGVLYFARSSIMTVLVIAEGLGPFAAFSRANALARGSNLHLLKIFGLMMLIIMVVYLVLFGLMAVLPNPNATSALASVLLIPVAPIIGGIMMLAYADLRVRKEGADLDAALDALTTTVPPLAHNG